MTNRALVAAALVLGRSATSTLKAWMAHPYPTDEARADTPWGKALALLAEVTDNWPPPGQIKLLIPILDPYRRDQATRSLTPSFHMATDWVDHAYRFEIDGEPIGTFVSGIDGNGTYVQATCPLPLAPGLHVVQAFEDTHGTVSVPVTFLIDPTNGPAGSG